MAESVLLSIANLLFPESRQKAMQDLTQAGILSSESARRMGEVLGSPEYSHRVMFRHIAPVKIALDRWIRDHRFNKFRPTAALDFLAVYGRAAPELIEPSWLEGRDVLDFGAGQFSPISVAVILFVNGAGSVTAFEPGGWRPDYVETATRELIADISMRPDAYALSPAVDAETIRRRLAEVRFDRLSPPPQADLGPIRLLHRFAFDEHPSAFDLVLSTSVFEHVQSFEAEIDNHLTVLKSPGLSINRIDFTDHRHSKPEHVPFGFYRDGMPAGCNLLRVSDLETAASRAAAAFEIKDRVLADESAIDRASLMEQFQGYDLSSLRTMAATFIVRK